ncbi:hypothetical protein BJ912DRAFT_1009441, partial [Pholiota molesta]
IRDGRLTAWVGRTTTTRLVPLNTRCRHCIRGGRRTIWFGRQRLVCGDDGCGKTSLQIDCVERRATGSVAGVTDERNLPATRRSLTETRWATGQGRQEARSARACRANLSMQEFTYCPSSQRAPPHEDGLRDRTTMRTIRYPARKPGLPVPLTTSTTATTTSEITGAWSHWDARD